MTRYLISFIFLCACSGPTVKKDKQQDTLFLQRVLNDSSYWAVFVDTTGRSEFYGYISDFSFGRFDSATFQWSLDYLKEHHLTLEEKKINGLPKDWIMIQSYRGKYYAYSPSDYYAHYKIRITDTALIDLSGEGPMVSKILSSQHVGPNKFRFDLTGQFSKKRQLIIHLIDTVKGLAVFEDIRSDWDRPECYLMADAARIRNYPIIVNYSRDLKQNEWDFDSLDYRTLIK